MDWLILAWQQLQQQSLAEWFAVALSVAYLWFAIRENVLAWPCALVSTIIFVWIFWEVSLLMESALNVYYMLMAIYGFWQWTRKDTAVHKLVEISRWHWSRHLTVITGVILASAVSGYLLSTNTQAAWPYLDSFTTWGAVVTTYMVARKILENWLYWIVLDSISLFLYSDRGLYATALLMVLFLIMSIIGFWRWNKKMPVMHRACT